MCEYMHYEGTAVEINQIPRVNEQLFISQSLFDKNDLDPGAELLQDVGVSLLQHRRGFQRPETHEPNELS